MDQRETANFLAMVKTAYPFFEVTEAGARLWHSMLQDMDYRTTQERLRHHILTSRFAPTISDIVNQDKADPSYYEMLRREEEQEQLALAAYNEQAVPMPDHIRERLERLLAKRKVNQR